MDTDQQNPLQSSLQHDFPHLFPRKIPSNPTRGPCGQYYRENQLFRIKTKIFLRNFRFVPCLHLKNSFEQKNTKPDDLIFRCQNIFAVMGEFFFQEGFWEGS